MIPVKNGTTFLPSLFKYLAMNIGREVPVIFVEDHSDDDTFSQILAFSNEFANVEIHRNPGNGLVDALNFGFSLCSTEWVARMDVDDLYSGLRFSSQMTHVKDSVAVIFSDYSIVRDNSSEKFFIPCALTHDEIVVSLVKNRRAPHPVALINRKLFLQVGGYRREAFPAEDLDLWIRISTVGDLAGVPEILFEYRRHSSSITGGKRRLVKAKHAEIISSTEFRSLLGKALENALINLERTFDTYKVSPRLNLRIFHLILDMYFSIRLKPEIHFSRIKLMLFLCRHISVSTGAIKTIYSYFKFRL